MTQVINCKGKKYFQFLYQTKCALSHPTIILKVHQTTYQTGGKKINYPNYIVHNLI